MTIFGTWYEAKRRKRAIEEQERNTEAVRGNTRANRLSALVGAVGTVAVVSIFLLTRFEARTSPGLSVNVSSEVEVCADRGWVIPSPIGAFAGPPAGSGARQNWAAGLGGVPANERRVQVAIQSRSAGAVVLKGLRLEVMSRRPPVAGTHVVARCGGPLAVRYFAVDLDASAPEAVPRLAEPDFAAGAPLVTFPYTVSETDPEYFDIRATTETCDCTWRAELEWVADGKRRTTWIDDGGEPFRVTSSANAPTYESGQGETLRPLKQS